MFSVFRCPGRLPAVLACLIPAGPKRESVPRKCSICSSAQRLAVEHSILAGDSYRTVAQRFHVSRDAVVRHRRHLTLSTPNSAELQAILRSGSLVDRLRSLTSEAQRLKEKAEIAGDIRTALAAVRELCRIVELIAKVQGQINDRPEINVVNFQFDPETARRIGEIFLARHQLQEGPK